MRSIGSSLLWLVPLCLGCASDPTHSQVTAPGEDPGMKATMLDRGANALQDTTPVDQIHQYLVGFHFYSGEPERQLEAHHFCSMLNGEVHQCVIYDGNAPDAKLIGVEYIISRRLFEGLPEQEKALWHSHHYEVKSGQLDAPDVPGFAEHALMEQLVDTYGKTFHLWQVDRGDTLPLGTPRLMMGFTHDGQVHPDLVADRDRRFEIDTAAQQADRADIPTPEVAEGANAWEQGHVVELRRVDLGPGSTQPAGAPRQPERPAGSGAPARGAGHAPEQPPR